MDVNNKHFWYNEILTGIFYHVANSEHILVFQWKGEVRKKIVSSLLVYTRHTSK